MLVTFGTLPPHPASGSQEGTQRLALQSVSVPRFQGRQERKEAMFDTSSNTVLDVAFVVQNPAMSAAIGHSSFDLEAVKGVLSKEQIVSGT